MSLALFITHGVSTTVIDQVLDDGLCLGYPSFFIAEPADVCQLERWNADENHSATKSPIQSSWRSNFLGYTPEQCATILKEVLPEPANHDDFRNRRRFAILDERFTETGELLACNCEEDGSVTSIPMSPEKAASCLDIWYADQWEDHLRLHAQQEALTKRYRDQRNSRKAALARLFREQETGA